MLTGQRPVGGISAIDPAGPVVLSFAQQRLWFLDQVLVDRTAYTVSTIYRIDGPCDVAALRWAVNQVWRRHDTLRSRCVDGHGVPRLEIADATALPVPIEVLPVRSAVDLEALEEVVGSIADRETALPFDLTEGPLVRARVLTAGADLSFLLLTFHHMVVDGWSMIVLWRDIASLYDSYVAGVPTPLPPLAVQYPAYGAWQRSWLSDERIDVDLRLWRQMLAGAPTTINLPTDRPRPQQASGRGGSILGTHPDVREVAVVAHDGRAGTSLAARPGVRAPSAGEVRAFLLARLPDYMVPATVLPMESLPLNHNGKIDRSALPAPTADRPWLSNGYLPPDTELEKRLCAIWSAHLGVASIGVTDGFFELGGHSLLVTRVVAEIRAGFDVALPIRAMFEHATVRGLAAVIEKLVIAEVSALPADEVRLLVDEMGRNDT